MSKAIRASVAAGLRSFRPYPEYRYCGVDWLVRIPRDWHVRRLKFVARINMGQSPPSQFYNDHGDGLPFLQGNADFGAEHPSPRIYCPEAPKTACMGDHLVSVRAPVGALNTADQEYGIGRGLCAVTPVPELIDSRFSRYVLQANCWELSLGATGSTYEAVAAEELANLTCILPMLDEQRAIAAFLDRETGKIDALVATKERLIELLREKRTALITRAVTKGLNPNVPMKDSGVGWLGEIPAHWPVVRNKVLFKEIDDRSEHGDEELLSVSHITGVTPRSEKEVFMFMAESMVGYKRCQPNDVAVNTMWAYMGALGVSPSVGIVSPSYNVYRFRSTDLLPEYFDLICRTPAYVAQINQFSKGIWKSRLRLYPDAFFEMATPVPPIKEQKHIVEEIRQNEAAIAPFTECLSMSIDRLKELRTALISAAVTGKIDVREEGQAAILQKRDVFAAEIIHRLHHKPTFGHVAAQKFFYLSETHLGVQEFDGTYFREAAGPYDRELLRSIDNALKDRDWYEAVGRDEERWEYRPLHQAGQHKPLFNRYWGSKAEALDRLISLLGDFQTRSLQIVATLYAAWNDFLIDGRSATDDQILDEVRMNWHHEKEEVRKEEWRRFLDWMKRNDLVPVGQRPKTHPARLL